MLNYPVMYLLSERAAVNMQGTVYLSKIENSSYYQELDLEMSYIYDNTLNGKTLGMLWLKLFFLKET